MMGHDGVTPPCYEGLIKNEQKLALNFPRVLKRINKESTEISHQLESNVIVTFDLVMA